jgi:hypothetical protein
VYTTGTQGDIPGYPAQATATVSNGVVTGVSILNAGLGYRAPPLVEFLGNGAGARATATITNGQVSSINLISGGSGYTPIPPGNQEVAVIISTGRVENLFYR